MQIRLLLDANLSWRSAPVLQQYFTSCLHLDSAGLNVPASDAEIWEYARKNEMVIVTNDEDFLDISVIKSFPPKVILLRTGNQSRKFVEQILIKMLPEITAFAESVEYGVLEII
jgi:predicted nuclease of predicted toxin-antitoxin system